MFERVYTIDEWRAGPQAGVANFPGARYDRLERQIADGLAARLPIAIMRGHFDFDPDRVRWTPVDRARRPRDVSQN